MHSFDCNHKHLFFVISFILNLKNFKFMLAEKITIIRLSSYHFQLLTFNLKQSLATFIARKSSNYFCRKMSVKLQEKSPIILLKLALIKLLKSFVKKCLTIKK